MTNQKVTSIGGRGFTLIELLVVIGIIAILAVIVLVAVNPSRQFAQARNAQRRNDTNTILNAIHQNAVDNNGTFTGTVAACGGTDTAAATLAGVLAPTYTSVMPTDPSGTDYTVCVTSGRYTVKAPGTEIPPETAIITVTR